MDAAAHNAREQAGVGRDPAPPREVATSSAAATTSKQANAQDLIPPPPPAPPPPTKKRPRNASGSGSPGKAKRTRRIFTKDEKDRLLAKYRAGQSIETLTQAPDAPCGRTMRRWLATTETTEDATAASQDQPAQRLHDATTTHQTSVIVPQAHASSTASALAPPPLVPDGVVQQPLGEVVEALIDMTTLAVCRTKATAAATQWSYSVLSYRPLIEPVAAVELMFHALLGVSITGEGFVQRLDAADFDQYQQLRLGSFERFLTEAVFPHCGPMRVLTWYQPHLHDNSELKRFFAEHDRLRVRTMEHRTEDAQHTPAQAMCQAIHERLRQLGAQVTPENVQGCFALAVRQAITPRDCAARFYACGYFPSRPMRIE